ncbi:multicopper oxidase family protein [Paenibacillus sp. LHD-117]|uniref:multicopper oxidase family protein n=1 Tax=Paenibacillus sp. LHD-117 TaxID=3071412 RepID=UPI0027E2060F|nr:multicopper oxidase family protein [Paenibacillus sp. LHD-117]MDQ6418752.1 multicopper oxidase family protein [Paenibacillus sp. LHD-117]
MYSLFVNTGQGALAILLIMSLIAANKASKLIFSKNEHELHRKTRKLVFWSWSMLLLALVSSAADAALAASFHPAFWMDRLLLRTPLVLLTALSIPIAALPRIARLAQRTQAKSAHELDVARRRQATETGLVMPFKLTALAAAGGFYFLLSPPIPFAWFDVLLPITILVFFGGLLWMLQSNRNQAAAASPSSTIYRPWRRRLRLSGSLLLSAAVISFPIIIAADNSRLPERMSMMTGMADFGFKQASSGAGQSLASQLFHRHHLVEDVFGEEGLGRPRTSVASLTGPQEGKADRVFTLTAKQAEVKLSSGKTVEAWTYNGQIPGPELRMKLGELIEVRLVNEDIADGVTIHWHGLDVPNAEDGVAGATQDAVMPGQTHTYRFLAEQVGTFWYHSHQHSKEAVEKGLFGILIVDPPGTAAELAEDITVATHVWDGAGHAIGSNDTLQRKTIKPGTPVKLRLLNTDNWTRKAHDLTGTSFKVTAIDGVALNEPEEISGVSIDVITGARYDVEFVMPNNPVYLSVDRSRKLGIIMSPDSGTAYDVPKVASAGTSFDPTHYGKPAETPFGPDSDFDREFTMVLDNKLAFYNGATGLYDTINGNVFPNTPMFVVKENEVVKTTIINRSAVEHPMHLHGHHMLVLSRNGETVSGSPWWSDTLDVAPGEVYEVAFLANNPGLWMDHCHNLTHAAAGMTMHLMYDGVTSPFEIGSDVANHPE